MVLSPSWRGHAGTNKINFMLMDANSIMLRNIKVIDIGLLGIYYFIGSIIFISVFNKFFRMLFKTEKYPVEKVSTQTLFLQACLQAGSISIISFYLRHFVRSIPYVFNGMYGYDHTRTKEINGGVVIAFAMITVFSDFKERALELTTRL
tara:strand:+ start:750 stop:1196 length:447 start_codon:yes stop_codon:yes gene_type:complete